MRNMMNTIVKNTIVAESLGLLLLVLLERGSGLMRG